MRYRNRVLSFLFMLSVITYLDRVCISVAGKAMQADLGLSPEQWGWVVGIFALSYAVFEIPTGSMGDRIGPRRILTRIVLWWSAFTSLTGLMNSFLPLVIVRFLFGAGEAGAYPNSSSSISRWFPVGERGRAHGIVWMASRIGGAVSPLVVIPIQMAYGWRASFFAFGVLGVIWAAVWYWWYRDLPAQMPEVTQKELAEIGPPAGLAPHGLPWGQVLRSWNLWKIMLMYHTYCWGGYFYLSWLHTYLQKGRGMTDAELGIYSAFPFIGGAFGNLLGGTVSDALSKRFGLKIGRTAVGTAGLTSAACCMFATAIAPDKWWALGFLTFGYFSMDCMLPPSWSLCLDVGGKYSGAVTGTMNMAGQIGSFLSAVAFGYMVSYFGSYNTPLFVMAGALLLSAGIYTQIDPNEQLVPEPVQTPELIPA